MRTNSDLNAFAAIEPAELASVEGGLIWAGAFAGAIAVAVVATAAVIGTALLIDAAIN